MAAIKRTMTIVISAGLLALGGWAWYLYWHYSDPETVRQVVLDWAAKAWPKASISIDRADADLFKGVCLRDCSLRVADDPEDEFVWLKKMTIVPDRQRILEGKLAVSDIALVGPTLRFRQDKDGVWNITKLLTGRKIRFASPTDVTIRDARIEILCDDPEKPDIILEHARGTVRLRPPGQAMIELQAHHEIVQNVSVEGLLDFVAQEFSLEGRTDAPVELAELSSAAPDSVRESFEAMRDIRGLIDLTVLGKATRTEEGFDWEGGVEGRLQRATAYHADLPYPIRDAEATLFARHDGLTVTDLRFSLGSARGHANIRVPGWKTEAAVCEGSLRGLELTPAIRNMLSEKLKVVWDRFKPTGFVDLSGKVVRVGEELALGGEIGIRDGTFLFEKFAYPVKDVTGRGTLAQDGSLRYTLEGRAGTADIDVEGTLASSEPKAPFTATIRGNGVTLDEPFLNALPPKSAKVVRDLHPGITTGDFVCVVERKLGEEKPTFHIDANVRSTEATWTAFPYRVRDVTGRLEIEPGHVSFHDVQGRSGTAVAYLRGSVWTGTTGTHTEIGVTAENVPLDTKLRTSLPAHLQPVLDRLRPEGRINVACNSVKAPDQDLFLEMEIDPANASIEPISFPYRMEGFDGRVVYRNGQVEWKPMTARHGDTLIRCSGSFAGNETSGRLELRNLESESLAYDEALRRAAPPSLRKTLDFLQPTKPVGIRFPQVVIQWEKGENSHWAIDLDGGIAIRDAELLPAVGLTDVNGVVWYRGRCENDVPRFAGNISLDTVTIEGFKAENLKSRFSVDGTQVRFPNIRGTMYGGQVHGSIRARTGELSAYECRLNLYGAKLQQYLQSRADQPANSDGLVYLDLFLEGMPEMAGRLRGRGKLDVLEADIDRLPILQDLFRIGNLQPPRGRAFEEVNCDFRVEDRLVRIETLDLLGPASIVGPSFNLFSDGEGTLDMDSGEVDLAVSARWGRGRLRVPVLTPSFNLASDQVFSYTIRGRLDDPIITPAPLKGFMRILEGDDPGEYARRRRFR